MSCLVHTEPHPDCLMCMRAEVARLKVELYEENKLRREACDHAVQRCDELAACAQANTDVGMLNIDLRCDLYKSRAEGWGMVSLATDLLDALNDLLEEPTTLRVYRSEILEGLRHWQGRWRGGA